VVALLDEVLSQRVTHGMALVRPPGHHAGPDTAMGFCLYNNAAIAVRHAQRAGAARVAVIDIDVHHGNGTEEIVWDDPETLYTSLHQWPFYPGTGSSAERGAHDNVVNVPLAAGTDAATWLQRFDDRVLPAVRSFRPDLLVVSAGYDAHRDDPLAGLGLTAHTYATAATRIADLAAERGIGSVWTLEGGYDLDALSSSVVATLHALHGDPESATLGG
jgi:acetoin utilization deacetylase AcuC-like enzyme